MRFTTLLTLLALSLTAAAGPSDAAVQLRVKFQPGEKITTRITQDMTSSATVMGNAVQTKMLQVMEMQTDVASVENGTALVTQQITRVNTTMTLPNGQQFKYDSQAEKNENPPPGYAEAMGALVGAAFKMKISPRGEISDIEVSPGLAEKFKALPGAAALGPLGSEEGLKQMMQQNAFIVPAEPIEKGATWDNSSSMDMPFGTIQIKQTYTYQGPASGNEQIDVQLDMKLEPKADAPLKMELKDTSSKGKILFDNEVGRLVSSEVTQNMEMEMTIQTQVITQSIEQKITTETLP